ncbi:TatD family hydrolase [bacterium]|nr:TatD family hydrolase [bacterium]
MFFDTHAHLDYDLFDADREEMIRRAFEGGVSRVVTIGTDVDSAQRAIRLAENYPNVYAAVGLHPTDARKFDDAMIDVFRQMALYKKIVAIGEIGLDYYWKETPQEIQHHVFRKMIRLAEDLDKPIVIHNREASDDVIRILQEERSSRLRGIMHCFSGDEKLLEASLDLNFFISFAGNLTYKKSALPEIVKKVPADRLLIETDAPFLTPVPYRGKRNEPAYVRYTAEKLAEILGKNIDDIARITSENAAKIFQLSDSIL